MDGDVVEMAVAVDRPDDGLAAEVRFVTMQTRERGKLPNFVIGGMDIAAAGMSLEGLLHSDRT